MHWFSLLRPNDGKDPSDRVIVKYDGPNRLRSFEEQTKLMAELVNNAVKAELSVGTQKLGGSK